MSENCGSLNTLDFLKVGKLRSSFKWYFQVKSADLPLVIDPVSPDRSLLMFPRNVVFNFHVVRQFDGVLQLKKSNFKKEEKIKPAFYVGRVFFRDEVNILRVFCRLTLHSRQSWIFPCNSDHWAESPRNSFYCQLAVKHDTRVLKKSS